MPPRTGKPEQKRFAARSGVLTSISSRRRSAISGCPLTQRIDLVLQSAARQTHIRPSQPHYGLRPAVFSDNDSLFLVASKIALL